MDEDREEQNRRRHRALAAELRRACLTIASGIGKWLADDPDEGEIAIIPGHADDLRARQRKRAAG